MITAIQQDCFVRYSLNFHYFSPVSPLAWGDREFMETPGLRANYHGSDTSSMYTGQPVVKIHEGYWLELTWTDHNTENLRADRVGVRTAVHRCVCLDEYHW